MNISGIICEYNPMHTGHIYQIQKAKENCDAVVCAMSGSFVQRGEAAFFDKWSRAKIAINNGADLVVLLPTVWSLSSARDFARAGVFLLNQCRCSSLCCGIESESSKIIFDILKADKAGKLKDGILNYSSSGCTFSLAYAKSCRDILGNEAYEFLQKPNNILALEYLRSIDEQNLNMSFNPIRRIGQGYNSLEISGETISASAIRAQKNLVDVSNYLALGVAEEIERLKHQKHFPSDINNADRAILYSIVTSAKEQIKNFVGDEFLSNRIYNQCKHSSSVSELINSVKTKNFTESSIKRAILRIFLKIPHKLCQTYPPYIQLLAANSRGLEILNQIKTNSKIPIVSGYSSAKLLDEEAAVIYDIECNATDLYGYFLPSLWQSGQEQRHNLIVEV